MSERVREITDGSFEREVLQSQTPVLVDFWAAWCGPCRILAPTIEAIAEQYSENVTVAKLNVDDNPSTTATYGIKGIPTLILFSEGKEVERMVGANSRESISRMIERSLSTNYERPSSGGVAGGSALAPTRS
jgi:thioredoxin 1